MLKELMLFSSAGSIFQPGELVFIDGVGFREFYKVISWGEYAQGVRSSYHERRQRKKAEKGQLVCLRYVSSSIPFTGGSTARIIRVPEILQRTTPEEAEAYVRQKFQEKATYLEQDIKRRTEELSALPKQLTNRLAGLNVYKQLCER